ncbi:UTP--glucose-1-phosphate uridylyltransferase GalU [Providencia vermicola]|uniref:UTP--glucose-1-phosphate uridylyltransferase n=3 Tax=Providencia TaxID=586 RepID=A0AAI9MYB5_PROST|nr:MULTISPECIES: UTP--glucose-1-phosphate uridylyltransferase GalU [Providencia]ELR5046445.1 UTP--glucose-1-phosphate uridylyltransferase GalU [Providencia rettgeri]ELR5037272.1 UTP--glucose-1-phosphate uridylyltransferase GalU [Providencia stuartii]ELR5142815.1 UTP--glucose-1-phosphate uridylyltransferase GalU [Providencia stuartii]ELR5292438.1 UTP--glucose-1-phosphate uridylyltransferase GalU [Providencia stuartii]ELX8379321.1 UTP--glucose-1-phosphate uridylyltransferase GalU [Providencia st
MLKAVIPVAGLGTRMLPATKAIPKEMLPLVDKPIIQYIIKECYMAGINEIIFVTHSSKHSIENHFDTCFELKSLLEQKGKQQLLNEIEGICPKSIKIMHVRQGCSSGLGHAILCAKPLIGDNDFIVVLPDVIINEYDCNYESDNLPEMIDRFYSTGKSQILIERVNIEHVESYGIVDCHRNGDESDRFHDISAIIEKPKKDNAPSNLAIVGRYILSKHIWPLLEKTPIGVSGEIQLTDALSMLLKTHAIEGYHIKGRSHDCGDKMGYMKAFFEYSRQHQTFGYQFHRWIKDHVEVI